MSAIAPGLKQTRYFFDERHSVLSDADADVFGPNVGADGRNLTIVFLSLNRSKLSIRLIDSIATHLVNFAGEVLIGDNGSDPVELDELRSHLQRVPFRWRLLEFKENLGVAGGRNRLIEETRTDWVISLDNDIYLVTNPLHQIQSELGTLGCHFMSFPLLNADTVTLFSHGGCLQTLIQNGRPRLTINPIATPGAPALPDDGSGAFDQAFLSTFLFGGASILNRHSFHRLGGFDDQMLIGFEDIDFSLRLFRSGMKIGTSALRFLVHDHPRAETTADAGYEKTRYARRVLRESAEYLEAKSGFRVWGDEVDNWLRENESKQGWAEDAGKDVAGSAVATPLRPRIALITDTDNWAFANISRQLKRYLGDRFEFEIFPLVGLGEIEQSRWFASNCTGYFADGGASALGTALVATEGFDVVHIFWREFLTIVDSPLLKDYARRLGFEYAQFRRRFIGNRVISTCVYDHLFLEPDNIAQRETIFTELAAHYYVASERLGHIYRKIPSLPDPSAVLPDGVDLTLFKPEALERLDLIGSRPIRVGWVGHSGWAATIEDFKGVNTILKPALEELQAEGIPLIADFADRKERFIPHFQMPAYYAGIDLLICTSKIEGTPNPVLEAMACGVPVITTDVGIVPQVFGERQKEFVLRERSVECLKDAILQLVRQPAMFGELSRENLESIKGWDWSVRAEAFADYFNKLVDERRVQTGEARTRMCMLPFSSPSMEPDGSIRLCSASSIFAYYDQTNMGNCRTEGLSRVWSGERYRAIRRGLVTGKDLKPFCASCEYRFDAPAWMMQLHLGLHAYHHGVRTNDVLALIERRIDRYREYCERAPAFNIAAYPVDDELRGQLSGISHGLANHSASVALLAPEELINCENLPIYMDFNTLNRCNVSCTMCPPAIRHDKLGLARDPYYRLTLKEYQEITEGVRINSAHFVGAYAEPLLNKDIFALVAYAHNHGAFTAITTNATALSREFAQKLLDAGLDMMTVSLHGATAQTAEAIMLKSNFGRIVENIQTLQQSKKERGMDKPELYFNYVAQKSNAAEMPAFIDLAHALRVRFVNFIHLIDGDEAVDASDNLINHPHLLVPNVLEAKERAKRLGIILYVSPAYEQIIAASGTTVTAAQL